MESMSAGVTIDVATGSVLYVPKHEPHRFHDVVDDLALLVFFAPAYGTGA
jgi:mannose-6-phosphate isomerase-like protein (cupin superfamily)